MQKLPQKYSTSFNQKAMRNFRFFTSMHFTIFKNASIEQRKIKHYRNEITAPRRLKNKTYKFDLEIGIRALNQML